jgi:hypothetical protein
MVHRFAARALLSLAIGTSPLCAGLAYAGLGGDAASVLSDADVLHGIARSTLLQQYDIHEITSGNGTRVREFLSRAGIVFAVTWNGPTVPDLQKLLGTRFEGYIKALAAMKQPLSRRSLRVAAGDIVVESGGHMRAYSGRAYLPLMIPAAMSAADIR